jgi:N-methylhydantoinase A
VPRYPGVTAALGLLLSDVRHDLRQSWIRPTAEVTAHELDAAVARLEADARDRLAQSGHAHGTTAVAFELDMRYRGQAYNLTVPLSARPVTPATLAAAEQAFHLAHRQAYDYTPGLTETEIVTLRVRATGAVAGAALGAGRAAAAPGAAASRDVWVDGERRPFAVVERDELGPGDRIGPATIVEQEDSTLIVPEGWSGDVGPADMIVLTRITA